MASSLLLPILSNSPQRVTELAPLSGVSPSKLAAALEQLPAERRLILSLHYHEDLDFEEVASILRMRRSVAESFHNMALAELRLAEISDAKAGLAF